MTTNPQKQKQQFGSEMAPIQATRAYRRKMGHFTRETMEAYSWILVNDNDKTVAHVNVYNGNVGRKWDLQKNLKTLDEDKLQKKVKSKSPYEEVTVADCPIATEATPTTTESAPTPAAV